VRKQDLQLLATARQGDVAARCELGRKYLRGEPGFPRHVATGLEYLSHPKLAASGLAAKVIAESLPLQDLMRLDQEPALRAAASAGSTAAQLKLALWLLLTQRDQVDARRWLQAVAKNGHAVARAAIAALSLRTSSNGVQLAIEAFSQEPGVDITALLHLAVTDALAARDPQRLATMLRALLQRKGDVTPDLADVVCDALNEAQTLSGFALEASGDRIEPILEHCVQRGNMTAALLLGRALCGINHGSLPASTLASGQNMRKGSALLLRAADGGKAEAWIHLYWVHSDNRASVSNPQMARFFLEKAARCGDAVAQRRLGALTLRSATSLHESEQGIQWLYTSTTQGDELAARLLRSLVLPVLGDEGDCSAVIDAIRRKDPWMACRLQTARDFGLTRLEALSVDIVAGRRTWGLVVGPNPFVSQVKRSAPRAVPALSPQVLDRLHRSALFFEQSRQDGGPVEGDLRKRTLRLRYLLDRHVGDERWFFADASSTVLHSLRIGTKWAFQARQPLQAALAP
jgi:TPR repeat protein